MKLHPQLEKDCITLGQFPLCYLLLRDDSTFPWFILVPARSQVTELHHLHPDDQQQLLKESMLFCQFMEDTFKPDKLNIASLGNIVSQLHIHHIARFYDDSCWPDPVWGNSIAITYRQEKLDKLTQQLTQWLEQHPQLPFTAATQTVTE